MLLRCSPSPSRRGREGKSKREKERNEFLSIQETGGGDLREWAREGTIIIIQGQV